MKFVVGLSLAIALGEFVLAIVYAPLVAYPFFMFMMLFGGDLQHNTTPFPAILAMLSMTVVPALVINWLRRP